MRLRHGRDEAIKEAIEKKPSFSDVFEIAPPVRAATVLNGKGRGRSALPLSPETA